MLRGPLVVGDGDRAFGAVCDRKFGFAFELSGHGAVAVRGGGQLVIVNRDPTPYDHVAVATIRQPISEAVPAIVDRLLARSPAG